MTRTAIWAAVALLTLGVSRAPAYTVEVTSSPAGAEVWASPVDHPVIYKKGVTPCEVALDEAGAPHVIIVRAPGRFDAYREVAAAASLSVTLAARDDPAAWARLPGVVRLHQSRFDDDDGPGLGVRTEAGDDPRPIAGPPPFVEGLDQWAPDASAFTAYGDAWEEQAEELGLVTRGEHRTVADIWWCPLQGEPLMLWRWISEPDRMSSFIMTGDFAPDPRWLVYSAAVGDREHVRLHCTTDGTSRPIAAEDEATIYGPFFSPSGRLVACIREQEPEEPVDPRAPEEVLTEV